MALQYLLGKYQWSWVAPFHSLFVIFFFTLWTIHKLFYEYNLNFLLISKVNYINLLESFYYEYDFVVASIIGLIICVAIISLNSQS